MSSHRLLLSAATTLADSLEYEHRADILETRRYFLKKIHGFTDTQLQAIVHIGTTTDPNKLIEMIRPRPDFSIEYLSLETPDCSP